MQFPILSTGAYIQRPYTIKHEFITLVHEMQETGYVWTDAQRPVRVRVGEFTFPALTDAEYAWLKHFFEDDARGRYETFSFTDPEGVLWPVCRFDMDELQGSRVSPNVNTCKVTIREVPA